MANPIIFDHYTLKHLQMNLQTMVRPYTRQRVMNYSSEIGNVLPIFFLMTKKVQIFNLVFSTYKEVSYHISYFKRRPSISAAFGKRKME